MSPSFRRGKLPCEMWHHRLRRGEDDAQTHDHSKTRYRSVRAHVCKREYMCARSDIAIARGQTSDGDKHKWQGTYPFTPHHTVLEACLAHIIEHREVTILVNCNSLLVTVHFIQFIVVLPCLPRRWLAGRWTFEVVLAGSIVQLTCTVHLAAKRCECTSVHECMQRIPQRM